MNEWEERQHRIEIRELKSQHQKELSECREDNIKLTKEIQEQDKELSDLKDKIKIYKSAIRLGNHIDKLNKKK